MTGLFGALAIAGWVGREAERRGRSGPSWGGAAFLCALLLLSLRLMALPEGPQFGGLPLGVLPVPAGPLAVLLVLRMTSGVGALGRRPLPMYRLSIGAQAGGECELLLDATALTLETPAGERLTIAYSDLERVEADHEVLRLVRARRNDAAPAPGDTPYRAPDTVPARELLLTPRKGPNNPEWRATLCRSLADHIATRMRRRPIP